MPKKEKVPQKRKGIVTASRLNLRPDPSTRKAPIGQLKRGTSVEILQDIKGWYRIKTPRIEGFVHGDFLAIQDNNPASGFLFEREDLRTVPLEPAAAETIQVQSGFSPKQKVAARIWNRQGGLLKILSDIIEVEISAAVAVLCVESSGGGFGPDGRMVIRFENHVFWRQWGKSKEAKFDSHFRFDPEKAWKRHEFRQSATAKWTFFHGKQEQEWRVFTFASGLNKAAAMRSISMGGPQIMGFNHAQIGFESAKEMFHAFQSDVRDQVLGLFDFLKGPGTTSSMITALQRKQFDVFASHYNGPGQAAHYGELIQNYFELFNSLLPLAERT